MMHPYLFHYHVTIEFGSALTKQDAVGYMLVYGESEDEAESKVSSCLWKTYGKHNYMDIETLNCETLT